MTDTASNIHPTVRVKATEIIGTGCVVYTAWTVSAMMGPHTSLTKFDDEVDGPWWGQIGTERNLPPEIDVLPARTDHRVEAVRAWHESRYNLAYAYIIAAHPELVEKIYQGVTLKRFGSIEIWVRK